MRRIGDAVRLRLAFRHPMDTGLVNIAAYYLDEMAVTSTSGCGAPSCACPDT